MKKLYLLLPILFLIYWSCGDDTSNNEEVVTFERDLGNGKLAVKQTSDGGYIVAGGTSDAWLSKMDKYGNTEWENTYSLGAFGNGRAVIQTQDGGYLYAFILPFLHSICIGFHDPYPTSIQISAILRLNHRSTITKSS